MTTSIAILLLLLMLHGMEVTAHVCDGCPSWFGVCRGCLLPVDPFVFIGRNLTMTCTLRSSNDSRHLFFAWKNDINISSDYQKVTSPYDLQLNMPMTDPNLSQVTVQCVDSAGLIQSQVVQTDYAPTNVTNIQILVNDWETLSLTWDSQPYHYPDQVNTSVMIGNIEDADGLYPCDFINHTFCFLKKNISSKECERYNVTISVTHKMGESNTQSISFCPGDHVKPSPVTSEEGVNMTSTSLVLRWNHRKTASQSLLYRVIGTHNSIEVYNKTVSSLYTKVRDLRPFTKYDFMIDTKSVDGGYWSDAVTVTVTTPEDKPDHGPTVTPGGYQTLNCIDNKRPVIIFLKPPDQDHRNGNLTHYNVTYVVFDGGPIFTSTPDPHSLTYTTDLYCHMDYHVFISVYTRIGASPTARLHIPKQGTVLEPKSVKVGYMNTTLATIQWEHGSQDIPLTWTVFWCWDTRTSFTSQNCKDEISWKKVDGSQTNLNIEMDSISSFIFGVSMTTAKGSSGIAWNDCIYETARAPSRTPMIMPVESRPNLALTVNWFLPVCEDLTLITHYIIQYCHNNSTHCASDKISSDRSEYVIPNLQEGVSYSVRLKEVALSGEEGQFSDPLYGVPIDTEFKTGGIVGIALAGVILLAVIIFSLRCARRKWKEKELIVMPNNFQNHFRSDYGQPPPVANGLKQLQVLQIKTKRCEKQTSIDSGRGSLSCVTTDNPTSPVQSLVPLSPTGQFQTVFKVLEEEGSLSGSVSKISNNEVSEQVTQLSQGYAIFAYDNHSTHINDVSPPEEQADTQATLEEDVGMSAGFSNDGFDCQSESHDPYVTAGNLDDDYKSDHIYKNPPSKGQTGDEEKGGHPGFCTNVQTDIQSGKVHKEIDTSHIISLDSSQRDIICQRVVKDSNISLSLDSDIACHVEVSSPSQSMEDRTTISDDHNC